MCLHGWPLDTFPMILRSFSFLEQTGKLNLPAIIIMRVPSTGSPSNPWFQHQASLSFSSPQPYFASEVWGSEPEIKVYLYTSAFLSLHLALSSLASKVMKIENFWQINKVICILLWSYFRISPTKDLFVGLPEWHFTWDFFMQHRESQKELNVGVLQPINSNF